MLAQLVGARTSPSCRRAHPALKSAVLGLGSVGHRRLARPLAPGVLRQGMVAFGFVASLPHAITVASGVRRAGRRPVRAKPRAVYPRAVQRRQPAQRPIHAIGPTLRPLNTAGPCPVAPRRFQNTTPPPEAPSWQQRCWIRRTHLPGTAHGQVGRPATRRRRLPACPSPWQLQGRSLPLPTLDALPLHLQHVGRAGRGATRRRAVCLCANALHV